MSDKRPRSLRERATERLMDAASGLVTRARTTAQTLSSRETRPADVADVLLMESQQAAFVAMHQRFTERADHGLRGLDSAVEALDAMWHNIRQLRGGAGVILLTLSSADETVQDRRTRFYADSTKLLEDAIRVVFAADLGQLALPPSRMAVLVRVALEGLVVELAQARTPEDVAAADQAYADLRELFARFVLKGGGVPLEEIRLEPIPLPW